MIRWNSDIQLSAFRKFVEKTSAFMVTGLPFVGLTFIIIAESLRYLNRLTSPHRVIRAEF